MVYRKRLYVFSLCLVPLIMVQWYLKMIWLKIDYPGLEYCAWFSMLYFLAYHWVFKAKNRYLKIDYKKDGEIIECFKSCNYKASNEFRDRTAVAYICEINLNPNILHFLKIFGITVNQEAKNDFTLSIFLQFLWRSNIRDAKSTQSIDVYIPSPRLRELFAEWLERGLHNK